MTRHGTQEEISPLFQRNKWVFGSFESRSKDMRGAALIEQNVAQGHGLVLVNPDLLKARAISSCFDEVSGSCFAL